MTNIKSLKAGTHVIDRDHCPVAFAVVDVVDGNTIFKVGQPIGAEFQASNYNFPISHGVIDAETGEYVHN